MPAGFPIPPPEAPKLPRKVVTVGDLRRTAKVWDGSGENEPEPQTHPKGSQVVAATPQHPAFAYPCPECLSGPYESCRNDLNDYITHRMVHVARTRVGAPVNDEGTPVFRAHSVASPAQDIARLAYWFRFIEATGFRMPTQCRTELAAAVARWPLESKR